MVINLLFALKMHLQVKKFLLVSVSCGYFGPVSSNCLEVLKKRLDLFLQVCLK